MVHLPVLAAPVVAPADVSAIPLRIPTGEKQPARFVAAVLNGSAERVLLWPISKNPAASQDAVIKTICEELRTDLQLHPLADARLPAAASGTSNAAAAAAASASAASSPSTAALGHAFYYRLESSTGQTHVRLRVPPLPWGHVAQLVEKSIDNLYEERRAAQTCPSTLISKAAGFSALRSNR